MIDQWSIDRPRGSVHQILAFSGTMQATMIESMQVREVGEADYSLPLKKKKPNLNNNGMLHSTINLDILMSRFVILCSV